jgi:DNA polymerase (family X)
MERVIEHARQRGCFFEINSSPDRLDLSAANARDTASAGVKIVVSTDAHRTRELGLVRYGLDQARKKDDVLNCQPWEKLSRLMQR